MKQNQVQNIKFVTLNKYYFEKSQLKLFVAFMTKDIEAYLL